MVTPPTKPPGSQPIATNQVGSDLAPGVIATVTNTGRLLSTILDPNVLGQIDSDIAAIETQIAGLQEQIAALRRARVAMARIQGQPKAGRKPRTEADLDDQQDIAAVIRKLGKKTMTAGELRDLTGIHHMRLFSLVAKSGGRLVQSEDGRISVA